jgi:two-component system, cell cycle sensor histidine kinase and response regulator CckA
MDGITRDIMEHTLTEEAVRCSTELYSRLVNSLDCIVWEADARTFEFSFVSPQAERMLS